MCSFTYGLFFTFCFQFHDFNVLTAGHEYAISIINKRLATLVEKLSFVPILHQLGCVIPNIHVTLDHFPMTLDISCHFGQCRKRLCFLLAALRYVGLKAKKGWELEHHIHVQCDHWRIVTIFNADKRTASS